MNRRSFLTAVLAAPLAGFVQPKPKLSTQPWGFLTDNNVIWLAKVGVYENGNKISWSRLDDPESWGDLALAG